MNDRDFDFGIHPYADLMLLADAGRSKYLKTLAKRIWTVMTLGTPDALRNHKA